MTDQTTTTTDTIALVNCANLAAAGLVLRGKQITGEWQLHKVGCRDLNDIIKLVRRINPRAVEHVVEYHPSVQAAREDFNIAMGPEAGFEEGGWDFDQHVEIKPCTKGL